MKNNKFFCLILLIISLLGSFYSCHPPGDVIPRAEEGEIDLMQWDFVNRGPVELAGDWRFIWEEERPEFSQPDYDDSGWNVMSLPGSFKKKGNTGTNDGYGWLRLRVKLKTATGLGLYLLHADSAYTLFVNGRCLMQSGIPGNNRDTTIPQVLLPQVKEFLIPQSNDGRDSSNIVTLAWKISNYHGINGGPTSPLVIGLYSHLYTGFIRSIYLNLFCLGISFFMFFYHLILWIVRKKDKQILFVSLCSFLIFLRLIAVSNLLSCIFPQTLPFIFDFNLKLEYIVTALLLVCMLYFFKYMYPEEMKKMKGKVSLTLMCMYIVFILITPYKVFYDSLGFVQVLMILLFTWITWKMIIITQKKQAEAGIILIGLVLQGLFILADILLIRGNEWINGYGQQYNFSLTEFGFVMFSSFQVTAIARRFARAQGLAEHLSEHLQTEVKQQTHQLFRMNRELEEKNQFKTRFFQNVTHDLRTPLTLIAGPLESALTGTYGPLPQPAMKQMKIATRNVYRLLDLINQLLDLSKLEAGKVDLHPEAVDMVSLLTQVSANFHSLAELKNLRFKLITDHQKLGVRLDREKTERILINLIANAFKYSNPGDSITVSLGTSVQNAGNGDVKTSKKLIIRVKDTGKGIDEQALPHIFKRFYQSITSTPYYHPGTGIGLSIVKEYVELQGGKISVESTLGFGSTFTVTLPYIEMTIPDLPVRPTEQTDESGMAATTESAAIVNTSSERQPEKVLNPETRILIVDDNSDMRAFIRENIKNYYLVDEAENGRQALEKISADKPAAVISDLMMPEMDGIELLNTIRSNPCNTDIAFIMLTAMEYDNVFGKVKDHEPDDFLSKPFNPRELLSRLQNTIKLKEQARQLAFLSQHYILPARAAEEPPLPSSGDPFPDQPVLIVDDNLHVLDQYGSLLPEYGINNLILCEDSRKVMQLVKNKQPALVLLDLNLPHISGTELLKQIHEDLPTVPVIIVTASNTLETAVESMQQGAYDYMVKPVEMTRLCAQIRHCIKLQSLHDDLFTLSNSIRVNQLENPDAFAGIITANPQFTPIFRMTESCAPRPHPVLITGESGVGKEMLVPVIHQLSGRKGKLVCVNSAGLDNTMFADTLFGHKRGAFTGADTTRQGLLKEAEGGTLFLDEIGDLQPESQIKLLRLLENDEYLAVGSDKPELSTARIIAATNSSLQDRIRQGLFREDLYHRFVYQLYIPPLRERLGDLPLLVNHFLELICREHGIKKPALPPELYTLLGIYNFPGNVRELRGMLENALLQHTTGNVLSLNFFKHHVLERNKNAGSHLKQFTDKNILEALSDFSGGFPSLEQVNAILTRKALEMGNGNLSVASRLLGVSVATLSRWVKRNK